MKCYLVLPILYLYHYPFIKSQKKVDPFHLHHHSHYTKLKHALLSWTTAICCINCKHAAEVDLTQKSVMFHQIQHIFKDRYTIVFLFATISLSVNFCFPWWCHGKPSIEYGLVWKHFANKCQLPTIKQDHPQVTCGASWTQICLIMVCKHNISWETIKRKWHAAVELPQLVTDSAVFSLSLSVDQTVASYLLACL